MHTIWKGWRLLLDEATTQTNHHRSLKKSEKKMGKEKMWWEKWATLCIPCSLGSWRTQRCSSLARKQDRLSIMPHTSQTFILYRKVWSNIFPFALVDNWCSSRGSAFGEFEWEASLSVGRDSENISQGFRVSLCCAQVPVSSSIINKYCCLLLPRSSATISEIRSGRINSTRKSPGLSPEGQLYEGLPLEGELYKEKPKG